MSTTENALLEYEGGQQAYPITQLADSGDQLTFTSEADQWSGRSGAKPRIKPNGLVTGGVATPNTGTDNSVSIASLSCYLKAILTSVVAGNVAITRPATNVAKVNSITVDVSGSLAVVAGTDSTDTSFSETRGEAGAPPYIPVDSIEIAQVRVVTSAAADIAASEIYQVIGLHQERFDFPIWDEVHSAGNILFSAALPLIHTAGVSKAVWGSFAEPVYTALQSASDFVPPETAHSQNSTPVYGGTVGSSSQSLNQGSFSAFLRTGVDDQIVSLKNETLWFRFWPDRYELQHILTQGVLGISRTFPSGGSTKADCTISATEEALNKGE